MQHRIVIVEKEKCNPEGCGGYLCARVSPSNRAGKEAFFKDVDGKIGVNEELVSDIDRIACNKCPFGALKMIKLPEELNEAPVHRYGKNGFGLYRLPVPIFNKVVGILGRNGIGKSTAIKILAGVLKPNLGITDDTINSASSDATVLKGEHLRGNKQGDKGVGRDASERPTRTSSEFAPAGECRPTSAEESASRTVASGNAAGTATKHATASQDYKALIEKFKGNEAQGYFEKLRDKKITLSYKPQQVEQLSKAVKGKVGELLKRVSEKGAKELDSVLEQLQLTHLLDRELNVLSGGELQRVAMAATVLKNANVLFFDEPTSYLDIKQRVRSAHFLQARANPETAVMVIDHDLIILDYMTELVHILYGAENGYGIVSQPKATKAGINVYLEGYLKEENVRFRDHKIAFPKHAFEQHATKDEKLAEWPAVHKTLGTFTLEAAPGTIHKHDIIGIVGENGIGKTTFVKELAALQGVTSRGALTVSHKPQYLEETDGYDAEATVGDFLSEAKKFETQLIKPLDLATLFEKKLSELSGGQLQRVVIARCLGADADLFLLDEPSAYLDVEQRLLMSKVLREMMAAKGKACLVVDHDLLFIDYLSEKLIVFEGEPGKHGKATGPFSMQEGMNKFLSDLGITFRRDEENNRPRANKRESLKDREQKANGKLYYTS